MIKVFKFFHLVDVKHVKEKENEYIECSNMTIINLLVKIMGPSNEMMVTIVLLNIQVSLNY